MTDGLERETPPPHQLKARVMRTLERQGVLRRAPRPWLAALRAAALLVVFLGGWLIGGSRRIQSDTAPPGGSRYLLLLYEDDSYRPDQPVDQLVAEYAEWAAAMRSEGRMTSAEQLGTEAWLIGGPGMAESVPQSGPYGDVTGFFVIVADGEAEALEIARTCPHLRHGGRIAVRSVVGA